MNNLHWTLRVLIVALVAIIARPAVASDTIGFVETFALAEDREEALAATDSRHRRLLLLPRAALPEHRPRRASSTTSSRSGGSG